MSTDGSFSSNYLQYLPAIFGEDPFLGRFLLAFEKILTGPERSEGEPERGLEQIIAGIPTLFDPDEAPEEFLDWLSGWVALSLRADWAPDQKRRFLANIVKLYRWRGTKRNLEELLKTYSQGHVEILEDEVISFEIGDGCEVGKTTRLGGAPPHFFQVTVTLPNPDPETLGREMKIVRALIDLQKPAHTAYEVHSVHYTMQIKEHSTIGVDTWLGPLPEKTQGGG
jgi:phage tail-like protein